MSPRQWESADGSIKKSVIKQGVFAKKPIEGSTCDIVVENINVSGTSVDDLKERYHTEILDGKREKMLIVGEACAEIDRKIERAIQMMHTNEKSLVTVIVPSLLVNGELVTLECEVTLIKCVRYKPVWEWSPEEKYEMALRYKESGVELYRNSRIIDAFYKFSRACKLLITLEPIADLESNERLKSSICELRLALYNNMAECQLKQENFNHVVSLCTKVLNKDRSNVKALYRRGVAFGGMKDNEKAVVDLKAALTLEPNNHAVKEQFHIYNAKLREANQKCNDMVRRMFKT